MLRRNIIPLLILLAALVGVGLAGWYYGTTEHLRLSQEERIADQRSNIHVYLHVAYTRGPIVTEAYQMSDVDGTSHLRYRVLGRSGVQVTITELPLQTLREGVNVAFLFDDLVRDGIWELTSKPPRGNTKVTYTIGIEQTTGSAHGSRQFTFTDPHYWATTGGHQFHLTLSKGKPIPDILRLSSTVPAEPRYGKLIEDFRDFGPPAFQARIAAARRRLGAAS